jgi:two-component system, chemotaxis family, chemotaxis protein CheY
MLRRVLLVEDHDGLRRLLGNFLSDKFEVVGAKNGLEAMTWLSKGIVPDVIITDDEMPEMDGADLLLQLRCTGLWANIPVVVLGAVEDSALETIRYKSLGAQDFFQKPFNPLALQDKLLQITGI